MQPDWKRSRNIIRSGLVHDLVVHMRIKRHHQRWTLPHNPHASVAMAMDAALVTFGPLEPTL